MYYYQPVTDAWVMNLGIHGWTPWSSMDNPTICKIMSECEVFCQFHQLIKGVYFPMITNFPFMV